MQIVKKKHFLGSIGVTPAGYCLRQTLRSGWRALPNVTVENLSKIGLMYGLKVIPFFD